MVNLDYLKNLNKAQTQAVTHLDGPLLIVAGAVSGKTKVLTSRIAHIITEKRAEIDTNKLVTISEFLSPINLPKNPDITDAINGNAKIEISILSF